MIEYAVAFDLQSCIRKLGLEEKGRIQQATANEVLRLSGPYVPFATGDLQASGHVENQSEVVWNTPYATYMWNGIVYEDPDLHCAGFLTDNGWFSRKGTQKVPTERTFEYQNGSIRGSHWVDKMMQNGGREAIERAVREMARK